MRQKYIRKRAALKFSDEFKDELDRRFADCKNGTAIVFTAE